MKTNTRIKKYYSHILAAITISGLLFASSFAYSQESDTNSEQGQQEQNTENKNNEQEKESASTESKDNNNDDFIPSEEISEDLSVAFPVDI